MNYEDLDAESRASRDPLAYHEFGRPGKIEVTATKPLKTAADLAMAYTPGVAIPCLEIAKDPHAARRYTARGNLVAVVTNGTAVLGLGNIGPLASKPVMEGKGVLFKHFADIDVFDIELNAPTPDEMVEAVRLIEPTFGGINLEDIKAPECFEVEERLRELLDIPVFHDDQHGTAIISGAALLNGLELVEKRLADVRIVVSGAGAAGIACAKFYIELGANPDNILMCDSRGVLWKGRGDEGGNKYKDYFYRDTEARTLGDALRGADVFCGASVKGLVDQEMVRSMAQRPLVFAMANPDPEISYEDAREARPDAIVATGRSDYPNQVNNVLGFPFIFRGALDVQASGITESMKVAAARALARLAKEDVPESVRRAYGEAEISFGPEYLIPKPFDPRALIWVAGAVAEAAIESGVARHKIDLKAYREQLHGKVDWSREVFRTVFTVARQKSVRMVLPEGDNHKVIAAAAEMVREGVARPVLLSPASRHDAIRDMLPEDVQVEIIDPAMHPRRAEFVQAYYQLRRRKGVTSVRAERDLQDPYVFASMMVRTGDADALIGGAAATYPNVIRPALQIIGPGRRGGLVAGLHMFEHRRRLVFLADTTVNVAPGPAQLAEIAQLAAQQVMLLGIKPRVAFLSFSNFGSARAAESLRVAEAVERFQEANPDIEADGPVHANVALDKSALLGDFGFSALSGAANVLVMPNLDAGNIAYKLLGKFCDGNLVGPILLGMGKPVHVVDRDTQVGTLVNLAAISALG